MQEYYTTATIHAPPDKIWAILTDGNSYRQWNPEIGGIDGSGQLASLILERVGNRQPEIDRFTVALKQRAESGYAVHNAQPGCCPTVRSTT